MADWLTNLNVSVSASSYGQPVHDGFNKAFKSMNIKLRDFRDSLPGNVTTIHCIGHSLGGALATICSEWLKKTSNKTIYLYTYGSPRVGLHGFSSTCTTEIGCNNIFRVYHKTDLVPYIPIWPFFHVPLNEQAYYLHSPGGIPYKEYHKMKNYIASVRSSDWTTLKNRQPNRKNEAGIIQWLKQESPLGLTISTIEWLNDALIFVLKKCSDAAANIISRTFSSSFTLMDKIAYILNKGIDLSESISGWVISLVGKKWPCSA